MATRIDGEKNEKTGEYRRKAKRLLVLGLNRSLHWSHTSRVIPVLFFFSLSLSIAKQLLTNRVSCRYGQEEKSSVPYYYFFLTEICTISLSLSTRIVNRSFSRCLFFLLKRDFDFSLIIQLIIQKESSIGDHSITTRANSRNIQVPVRWVCLIQFRESMTVATTGIVTG